MRTGLEAEPGLDARPGLDAQPETDLFPKLKGLIHSFTAYKRYGTISVSYIS